MFAKCISERLFSAGHKLLSYMNVLVYSGALYLSGLAYLLRKWRNLYYACAATCALVMICMLYLPESPRWLLMIGKEDEANQVLKRIARGKNERLFQHSIASLLFEYIIEHLMRPNFIIIDVINLSCIIIIIHHIYF